MGKAKFTPLQADTLQLLAEDKTAEQIAEQQNCTPRAVRKRLEKVREYFKCNTSFAAYRQALLGNKMPLK